MVCFAHRSGLPQGLSVSIDLLLGAGSYGIALFLLSGIEAGARMLPDSVVLLLIAVFVLIFLFRTFGLYDLPGKSTRDIVYSVGISVVLSGVVVKLFYLLIDADLFREYAIFTASVLQAVLFTLWKCASRQIACSAYGSLNMVIVSEPEEARQMADKVRQLSQMGCRIMHLLPEERGRIASLEKGLRYEILIGSSLDDLQKTEILSLCMKQGLKAYILPKLNDILLSTSKTLQFDDIPVLNIEPLGLTWGQRFFKRFFDILLSLLGLTLSFPVMVLISAIIKLDSKGSVFYKQERITIHDKYFTLFKFRTMINDAEKLSGPVLAKKEDERITRVGRYLRATRLDELPQLFNVLKGDMSFVGPRPERLVFIEQFCREYQDYRYRHLVKAGITGLAQVRGKYSSSAGDKLRFDLMYIADYSLLLDLKIILQTIKIVFLKESANGVEAPIDGEKPVLFKL